MSRLGRETARNGRPNLLPTGQLCRRAATGVGSQERRRRRRARRFRSEMGSEWGGAAARGRGLRHGRDGPLGLARARDDSCRFAGRQRQRALACGRQQPGHPPVLAYAVPGQRPSVHIGTPRLLSKAARSARSWTGLSSREASAAVAGFNLTASGVRTANSGLVGCLRQAQCRYRPGLIPLDHAPADPRQAQKPFGVFPWCFRLRSDSGAAASAKVRWPEVAFEFGSSGPLVRETRSVFCSSSLEVPPSGVLSLHPACHPGNGVAAIAC